MNFSYRTLEKTNSQSMLKVVVPIVRYPKFDNTSMRPENEWKIKYLLVRDLIKSLFTVLKTSTIWHYAKSWAWAQKTFASF